MTAFAPANIPSSVGTLEELAIWAISALAEINPTATVQTTAGTIEPVANAQTYRFANQATNPERMILVAYIPLAAGWRSNGKVWSSGTNEISTTALPAAYTTP